MHEVGSIVASTEIAGYLTNRLRIVDWVKRNPEIRDRDIRPPIVILGQPRTGTTILFGVLAQDPANRVPLTWEVDQPWPPPETATYETDPRIGEVQASLEAADILIPGFMAMHAMGAQLGQECVRITGGEFRSMIFSTQYRVPDVPALAAARSGYGSCLPLPPPVSPIPAIGTSGAAMGGQVTCAPVVAAGHDAGVPRRLGRPHPP